MTSAASFVRSEQTSMFLSLPEELLLKVATLVLGDKNPLVAVRNALGFIRTSSKTYELANDHTLSAVFKDAKNQVTRWVEDPNEMGVSRLIDLAGNILKVQKIRMHV